MEQPTMTDARTSWAKPQPEPVVEPVILLPTDFCDKCGPGVSANCAIRLTNGGVLTLCLHHYNEHAPALLPLLDSFVQNTVS